MLNDTCSYWEMGEERRISAIHTVGDAESDISLMGDGRRGSVSCPVGDAH